MMKTKSKIIQERLWAGVETSLRCVIAIAYGIEHSKKFVNEIRGQNVKPVETNINLLRNAASNKNKKGSENKKFEMRDDQIVCYMCGSQFHVGN
mgnify:CR=1 FL=1